MRILEINKFYYERRGAERHFLDVIRLFRDAGHEVAVFTMDDPRNVSREYAKYTVSPVGYNHDDSTFWQRLKGAGRLFWSFEARRKMRALLADFRPDMVHLHNAYHQLSFSFLPIIRSRGIPIVMTVHDYHLVSPDKDAYYESVGQHYWKFLLVSKYSFGKRLLLICKMYWERSLRYREMIDRFIAPSEFVKEVLVKAGVDKRKILVITHFVTSETYDSLTPFAVREPYVLYFGAVTEEKNIRELVTIFERLHYPLVLAGKKDMEIPDGGFIRYVGEREKGELSELIRGASCVVSASRLPETFGLVILEANACGKPFFGYRTGAFPDIVENGKNGWLAGNADDFFRNIDRFLNGSLDCLGADDIRVMTQEKFGKDSYLDHFPFLSGKS